MANTIKYILLIANIFLLFNGLAQQKPGFAKLLKENPDLQTTFCVPNDIVTKELLEKEKIKIKYSSSDWLFIRSTARWMDEKSKSKELKSFYFEFAPPVALADTALMLHNVNQVHLGSVGLSQAYTGENVIIGYVDQGIDWRHPDFKDENGNTRVLRYWDHSTNSGGPLNTEYGYGIVWDSSAINAGLCTSDEQSTAHGTTVAGMGSGNGRANGSNKGVAPNSKIIVVESNFNLPNWTLSIADACDYIFKVADTLGLPAVVNLSLGSYLGSHDGNDPASQYMESLLDEKEGRIIVCAAGNSGAQGKYHVRGNIDADTSFTWFLNNSSPSAAFGPNHIYFDLWSEIPMANYDYGFGANLPSGTYSKRGVTSFHGATSSIGTPILDTIYNSFGNRIATIETYTEIVGTSLHMEVYFSNVDSTSYNFSFLTTGSGSYDLWSGAWLGLNTIQTTIPSSGTLPQIVHYHMPDSLQSIVSSWNCSEKIISVGNVKNRKNHIDNNGNTYVSDATPVGGLSVNSSKGPSRLNVVKPDVSASGDVSLTAAPLWLLTNPSYNSVIDSGGWHARNGGTSMASPVVAGIAAIYLEKCDRANYDDFKTDLLATAMSDIHTGATPNFSYGYGKPSAYDLMLQNEFSSSIHGTDSICPDDGSGTLSISSSAPASTAYWSDGYIGLTNNISESGDYSALVYNTEGCKTTTDTFTVHLFELLPMLPIIHSGNTLATLSLTNYQWTLNGVDIPGATNATLEIFPPYGTYTCYCISNDGCKSETPPYTLPAGLDELDPKLISIFPNPTNDKFKINSNEPIKKLILFNDKGQVLNLPEISSAEYSVQHLSKGVYHLIIETENEKIYSKITRM